MTSQLPRIDQRLLKNAGAQAAVERIWQRLENEAPLARYSRAPRVWALALASVTFAAGLWLGMQLNGHEVPSAQVAAEPATRLWPVSGAVKESAAIPRGEPAAARRGAKRAAASGVSKTTRLAPLGSEQAEVPLPSPGPTASAVANASGGLGSPEWMRLANLGDYVSALRAVEEEGGFDQLLATATADRLMASVDVARATGQKGRALQALRKVLGQFSGSPEAPLAAWTLGNMLEQVGDPVGAAAAFAQYQRLSPQGDFAEDAVVRQLEALITKGQADEARRLAKSYEAEFPESLRLRELGEQLQQPVAATPETASSAPIEPGAGSDAVEGQAAPTAVVPSEAAAR